AGNDIITLSSGIGLGGTGDDTLTATTGTPVFFSGGDGNDSLVGNAGTDTLLGSSGDDNLRGNGANDLVYGGSGYDVAHYSGRYTGSHKDYLITDHLDGTATIQDLRAGSPEGTDSLIGVEHLVFDQGGSADLFVPGGVFGTHLYGTLHDDILSGDFGPDTIYGGPTTDV